MTRFLDFDLLPDLSTGSIIRRLDPDLEEPLSKLRQTKARADASIRFAHISDFGEDDLALREAYLRASLSAFAAMEETLPRDLRVQGIPGEPLRLYDSANPLVHMIRELRNLEIHLRSSRMNVSKTTAYFTETKGSEELRQIELTVWWIEPISLREFTELRNSKRYSERDAARMLVWFNDAQKVWGVGELVRSRRMRSRVKSSRGTGCYHPHLKPIARRPACSAADGSMWRRRYRALGRSPSSNGARWKEGPNSLKKLGRALGR